MWRERFYGTSFSRLGSSFSVKIYFVFGWLLGVFVGSNALKLTGVGQIHCYRMNVFCPFGVACMIVFWEGVVS